MSDESSINELFISDLRVTEYISILYRINFINETITTLSFPRSPSPTQSGSGNLSGIKEE